MMAGEPLSLDQRFADAMGHLLGPDFPDGIGLAVSGGGDSMAMLTLAHNWAHRWGVRLNVVTVDHGLRRESADEAEMVAEECRLLGHAHSTLRWHWDGQGNVMDCARRGRLSLIDQWRGDLRHVLMAHTRDDVAETFVMRLARGSGVDGLAAMAARRFVASDESGFWVIRPCLDMGRDELRHYLRTLKGRWVEDPSNDDPAYGRVKVRQARAALEALGLDAKTLAATAQRMARARDALTARALRVWSEIGEEGSAHGAPTGEVLFAREGFEATDRDTQLRLLAAALQYISGAEYRPRADPLEALLDRLLAGGGGTLWGCEAVMERGRIRVFREFGAVSGLMQPLGQNALWDGRWQVALPGPQPGQAVIRALGEDGWQQIPRDIRADGPAFRSARSFPSVWQNDRLIACDAMGIGPLQTLRLKPAGQPGLDFAGFLSGA